MTQFEDYIKVPEGYSKSTTTIYTVTTNSFKEKLNNFLARFIAIQQNENHPVLPSNKINSFPDIEFEPFKNEIFSRKQDLKFLQEITKGVINNNSSILEIGGWNGWLTKHLFKLSERLVTVDIFSDERNGLASKKYYVPNHWLSVQADVTDITIYKCNFDFIIFNHCLQFYPDPLKLIEQYKSLLNKNGIILILGANIYRHIRLQQKRINKFRDYYKDKYDFNIQFYDCNGFFDFKFYNMLFEKGFVFSPYVLSLKSKMKKFILCEKSGIFIYRKL